MSVRESRVFRAPPAFQYNHPPWRTFVPVLFWTECVICETEVRWERMWCALTGPWIGGRGHFHYACQVCVPLHETVQEAAYAMSRAICPPFPPHVYIAAPPRKKADG